MAVKVVSGVTYYEFGVATFVTVDATTTPATLRPLANAALTLYAAETGTTAPTVINASNVPLTGPTTTVNGETPSLWATQFDTIFADAGAGRKPLLCLDLAEAINGVATTASDQAVGILNPRLTATEGVATSKYLKPSTGIPKTDTAAAVQTSLTNADTLGALFDLTAARSNGNVWTYQSGVAKFQPLAPAASSATVTDINLLPAGIRWDYDYYLGGFGTAANAYPAARPFSRPGRIIGPVPMPTWLIVGDMQEIV